MNAASPGRRVLGLPSLLALGVNGVVGVGIFFAPSSVAAAVPGVRGVLVYVAVALACVPVAHVFARLGRAFDEDGGPYVYARAAFGDGVATVVGWIAYVSAVLSASSVVLGLVTAVGRPAGAGPRGLACAAALLTTLVSLVLSGGLLLSARVWTAVTVAKLLPLGALVAAFVALAARGGAPDVLPPPSAGTGTWLGAALTVLFALQGFEIVPVPAGHVRDGARAVPVATVLSLGVAAALYVCVHGVAAVTVPDLAHAELPLAEAARVVGGAALASVLSVGTTVSALGIAVGMLAMTPRYLAALGAGGALGARLGESSARGVPVRAMVVTSSLVVVVAGSGALWGSVAQIFALASLAVLSQYAAAAASLVRLALHRRRGLAPRDAWPAPLVAVSCALLVAGARLAEVAVVAALAVSGLVVGRVAAWRSRD